MPYAQGIGFAVPVNTAKAIMKDSIENGRAINNMPPFFMTSSIFQ